MAQIRVIGGDLRSNLLRAGRAVESAAASGADIVILPEAMDLGWTHHSANQLAEPIPDGATFEHLSNLAADHALYLCAGITEQEGDAIYNSAVLIDRRGRLLIKHRKINELEFARKIYRTGEETQVCATEFGKIGVMICADAFADELHVSRAIGRKGARLILSPCAWAVPADYDHDALPYGQLWVDSYAPVAQEFKLWIAGVSCVGKLRSGEWAGHHCIGSSMLVNPDGKIETRSPFGREAESLTMVEIPRD